jgi:hypothetical protein
MRHEKVKLPILAVLPWRAPWKCRRTRRYEGGMEAFQLTRSVPTALREIVYVFYLKMIGFTIGSVSLSNSRTKLRDDGELGSLRQRWHLRRAGKSAGRWRSELTRERWAAVVAGVDKSRRLGSTRLSFNSATGGGKSDISHP